MSKNNYNNIESDLIVTIPTYNRADHVCRAIDSVLEQSCENWLLLILDDGSVDNTEEVISKYEDERILYLKRNENRGLVYTFNEMLDFVIGTKSKYWSWLASDDRLLTNFVEKHIGAMSNGGELEFAVDVTWSDYFAVRNGNRNRISLNIDPASIVDRLKRRVCISLASMCISVDVLRSIKNKYGCFCSDEFVHMNDWDFLLKLSSVTDKFKYVDDSLSEYNIHESMGSSGVYFGKTDSEESKIFMKERSRMLSSVR